MTLGKKTNSEIHHLIKEAAQSEKNATIVLLEYLLEVESRRLYAVYGYDSLWGYVHKELNYSEAQASDRISAMYAIKKLPEVKVELENGSLSLTAAAKLGSHARRERLDVNETKSLLLEVSGKSSREVERILVSKLTELKPIDSVRPISSKLTRITLDVDHEFLEFVSQVKELKNNLGLTMQEVFLLSMKEVISKENLKNKRQKNKLLIGLTKSEVQTSDTPKSELNTSEEDHLKTKVFEQETKRGDSSLRAPEVKNNTRYIKAKDRLFIKIRAQNRCEYISPVTNTRCNSQHKLEIDHIQPFAKGGANELKNLRYLCRAHNQLEAITSFGEKKMNQYFRKT